MRGIRLCIACLGLALAGASAHADQAPARVAVIADAGAENLAALVTARLSGISGLALVERDDLAKIGDERTLREMAANRPTELGNLLHADGLLFLRKEDSSLAARLTAVRLGLVLFDVGFDPQAEPPQLADLLANRLENLKEKLALPQDKAIPVSFLNLHADMGDPAAVRLEQSLTLLLERALVAVPELVVLERRHAGALALERNLSADLPQAQTGAWWIDGALNLPNDNGPLGISLRLRSPKGGSPLELTASGSSEKLPSLADGLAADISRALHATPPPGEPAPSAKEAREFLKEAVWAWRHGKLDAAVEALDSAALLGETAPDLFATQAAVLLKRSSGNSGREVSLRLADLLGAIDATRQYIAAGGPSRLQVLANPLHTGEGRIDLLNDGIKDEGTWLLRALRDAKDSREEDLRRTLREFCGYDPLHGKVPNDWPIAHAADLWSESVEEEAAYYHGLCDPARQPGTYWQRGTTILSETAPEQFAARFLDTPAERSAAFMKLVGELAADPSTRPAGLFLRAVHEDPPTRQGDYQAFLDAIGNDRQPLQDSGNLWAWLVLAQSQKKLFPPPADAKLISLLHFYLQHETKWGDGPQKVWQPDYFPKEEAPALWGDLEACKARCLPNGGQGLPGYFSTLEDAYLKLFADPSAPPAATLTVSLFWHPEKEGEGSAVIHSVASAPDGFWVFLGAGIDTLYHVRADTLTASKAPPLPLFNSAAFLATPQAVYVVANRQTPDAPPKTTLSRYDIAAGTWESREVTGISRLYAAGNQLYFFFYDGSSSGGREVAIGKYDWATDQKVILASNRRVPPQTPFDSKPIFHVQGFFTGPDGKPCVLIDYVPYLIPQGSEGWLPLCRLNVWYDLHDNGSLRAAPGQALLFGHIGFRHLEYVSVTLVDPSKPMPEQWLGAVRAIPDDPKGLGATPLPEDQTPEWARHPIWPGDQPARNFDFTTHGGDLFAFNDQRESGSRYALFWFPRGKSAPIRIPLRFALDEATRALLPALCNDLAPQVADPETAQIGVTMIATSQGLCFRPAAGGVWFLPFSDLDAYLKANAPQ